MPLFKKKKSGVVPEPPGYEFPETEAVKKGIHETMKPLEEEEAGELPELPEMPEEEEKPQAKAQAKQMPKRLTQEIGTSQKGMITREMKESPRALFVKVEKFKEIVASVDEISRKIQELETTMAKAKDIRAKEDAAMAGWQEEVEDLKEKLDTISKTLSEKIE
jgi:vacuolar-type H+-ATPase subunit I/STV1